MALFRVRILMMALLVCSSTAALAQVPPQIVFPSVVVVDEDDKDDHDLGCDSVVVPQFITIVKKDNPIF